MSQPGGAGRALGRSVAEVFAIPQNVSSYYEWVTDPRTKLFMEVVENSIRPLCKPETMPAERYGGLVDGRYEVLWLLTHLDEVHRRTARALEASDVSADYGAEPLLGQWGVVRNVKPADRPAETK